jgi:hypothetical protein
MNKIIFLIILFFITTSVFGQQGFTYSYVDPCSKTVKTIFISSGQSVTINYLGFLGTFSQSDFQNGVFENWVNTVSQQSTNQPCDELLTATQTGQNQIITQNIISTLTSITAASSMSTNTLSTSVSNATSSSSNGPRRNRNSTNNQQNTTTNGTSNNSQGNSSNGSTSQSGGSQQGGNESNNPSTSEGSNQEGGTPNESGNVSQGGSGQTKQPVTNPPSSNTGNSTQSGTNTGQGGGSNTQSGTNSGTTKQNETSGGGQGGTTASISNVSSSSSSKGGSRVKVGSLIGTGDLVVLRSNEDGSNQFKGTMSMTKSNTNNTFAKGLLLNFTTSINNTNLTIYGARSNRSKTNTLIFANSSMVDFKRNIFNTTTVMDSKRFGKVNLMGGLNFTIGGLAGKPFTNLSAVGGGFIPFTANKKISGNILLLGVYSPFTKFYDGKWWDSGLLIVPFSSWDYTISKSFKYNISISGTYQVKGSILNYQILTGGKILL